MKWQNPTAASLKWSGDVSNRAQKEEIASELALRARDGQTIGIGSGSTAFLALVALAKVVKERRIRITALPTSAEVALACAVLEIPTTSLLQQKPDWSFDGADEVDPQNNLIKGRGGAMFREKLLMRSSPHSCILVDSTKLVDRLGEHFPIPVETYPEAIHSVESALLGLGSVDVRLRLAKSKDGPVITEAGNFILDARFEHIGLELEKTIKLISGVIESGLFLGYPVELLVAGRPGFIPPGAGPP